MAAGLLETTPVHRVLGLTVERAAEGTSRLAAANGEALRDALHTSETTTLIEAAGFAAIIAAARDEPSAHRLRLVPVAARLQFHNPVSRPARAVCHLTDQAVQILDGLFAGDYTTVQITTHIVVDTDRDENAVTAAFDWSIRLTSPNG